MAPDKTHCSILRLWPAAAAAALAVAALATAQTAAVRENNDFYDNEPFVELAFGPLEVVGEVAGPGRVDLAALPLRTVMVREARSGQNGVAEFIGSYVYQGPSLFDILREFVVKKKDEAEFSSVVDLLVIVENADGEKAVFSWGEVFYPSVLHRVIVARKAAPIVPSKTGERWPLPRRARVVAANDLIADRTIEDPVRVRVVSVPLNVPVEKGLTPLRSPSFRVVAPAGPVEMMGEWPRGLASRAIPAVFFGRGRGFHGISRFEGVPMSEALKGSLPADAPGLRRGYVVVAGADGYRAAFTVSELVNRNDNGGFLLCDRGDGEGGRFTVFPAPDFFSDRAVKAIKEIHVRTLPPER